MMSWLDASRHCGSIQYLDLIQNQDPRYLSCDTPSDYQARISRWMNPGSGQIQVVQNGSEPGRKLDASRLEQAGQIQIGLPLR